MQQHVRILGWLNIVYGSLGILFGVIIFAVLGGIAGFISRIDPSVDAATAAPIIALVGTVIVVVLIVISAPAIIAGIGLLGFRPWARILAIVLSALHLPGFPIGTALGVYGLWVLLTSETEVLFRQTAPPLTSRPYA